MIFKAEKNMRIMKAAIFSVLFVAVFYYPVVHVTMDRSIIGWKVEPGLRSVFAEDPKEEGAPENKAEEGGEEKKEGEGEENDEATPSEQVKVVLDGLEEKRKRLQDWEVELNAKQKKLEELKGETEEKLEKNTGLLKKIEDAIASLEQKKSQQQIEKEQAHEAEMAKLVKLYSGMKPKNAADIVNNMDMEVAKELFSRMKGAKAAKLLSFVNSERAARISERIAAKKR